MYESNSTKIERHTTNLMLVLFYLGIKSAMYVSRYKTDAFAYRLNHVGRDDG